MGNYVLECAMNYTWTQKNRPLLVNAGLPAVRGQLARKPEVPLDAFKKSIQKHPRELFQMRPADKPESAVVQ